MTAKNIPKGRGQEDFPTTVMALDKENAVTFKRHHDDLDGGHKSHCGAMLVVGVPTL